MRFPEFCGASYKAFSPMFCPEVTMNWVLEPAGSRASKSPAVLLPIQGVEDFGRSTAVGGRGLYALGGKLFGVQGNTFCEFDSNGNETVIGNVAADDLPASMTGEEASRQVLVASGNNGYHYNWGTGAFSQVRTGGTRVVDMLDGFALALDIENNSFAFSDLNNFASWDPTDVVQRAGAPDPWIAMRVAGSTIWLIGTETCEPWWNAGGPVLPFQRHPAGVQQAGCAATFSAIDVNGNAMWLGRVKQGVSTVYRTDGYTPVEVGDFALATALDEYETINGLSNAWASTYLEKGHLFANFYFPRVPTTWTNDVTTKKWAQRGTWDSARNQYGVWRPSFTAHAFNKHVFSDRIGDGLYSLSDTSFVDIGGGPIRYRRVARGPFAEHKNVDIRQFQLFIEAGKARLGVEATCMFNISGNGGRTWSFPRWKTAGVTGDYMARPRWDNCGTRRDPVVEVVVTAPFAPKVVDAYMSIGGEAR